MISVKKIAAAALLAVASVCCADDSEKISVFSRENADYWLSDARAAFGAYVGNWVGSESMTVEGNEIMRAEVAQSYVPSAASNPPRLVCSGKIVANGKSIPTSSYMYLKGDALELEIMTVEKDVVVYVGKVERNSVYWTPKYMVYVFDVQRDSFFSTERGFVMSSGSKKFVETPDGKFSGYIEVSMVLERDNGFFPASKSSNSARREFSASPFGSEN